ncbi:complement C1q-like protein 2 [Pecten maximus]|uniref:complement C1q-like protein 2 n=1 Tax=Pecten maximus TaxID=6579 RepID=UPI0014588ED0|nr:complement C1q-like protein 2 [Pecten maximus]
MDEQEARILRLETMLSENVGALRNKDNQIQNLKMRVADLESKMRPEKSIRKERSLANPTRSDQQTQSDTVANRLNVNTTVANGTNNGNVNNHGHQQESSHDEIYTVKSQGEQQKTETSGSTEPRTWSNRVGPAIQHNNVAFSVSMSGDTYLQAHEILLYNKVIVDNTNMFNTRTGMFLVPVSGVYVFTWSSTSGHYGAGAVWTSLRIDGVSKCATFADSFTGADYESSTGLIVINVNQGVSVYIRAEGHGNMLSNNYTLSTFSGWRLF